MPTTRKLHTCLQGHARNQASYNVRLCPCKHAAHTPMRAQAHPGTRARALACTWGEVAASAWASSVPCMPGDSASQVLVLLRLPPILSREPREVCVETRSRGCVRRSGTSTPRAGAASRGMRGGCATWGPSVWGKGAQLQHKRAELGPGRGAPLQSSRRRARTQAG